MKRLMKMMLMKILLLPTDCEFSGSRGAQMNGCSHLPENHQVLESHSKDVFIRWRVQISRETPGSDFNGQSDKRGSPFEPI